MTGDRRCARILIIDDNTFNRKLFAVLLESRHYEVVHAATGDAGLDLACERQPNLIVLDIQLPDMSGIEVARALKADRRTRDIPIVAITAALGDQERAVRASGCDDFMRKPLRSGDFLATVEALLQRARVAKQL